MASPPTNEDIACALEDLASLLEGQDANPHRVRAYREAARTVRSLPRAAAEILAEGGRKALEELPGIGKSISGAIEEKVRTGRIPMLERLLGSSAPEDLFMLVPGIGEDLARRIHEELEVETLEDLEAAAHDGRLARVEGFGDRRVRAIQDVLATMLSRSARRGAGRAGCDGMPAPSRPTVSEVLAIDERYRLAAQAGSLRTIAPRRFNPEGKAWLPILHVEDGGWQWTAMWSNTARAHQLGRTHDWVVVTCERDGDEDQCTVVTETRGPLAGRRVVRGREAECAAFRAAAGGAP